MILQYELIGYFSTLLPFLNKTIGFLNKTIGFFDIFRPGGGPDGPETSRDSPGMVPRLPGYSPETPRARPRPRVEHALALGQASLVFARDLGT